jgi:hypothetical protein
VFKAIWPGIEVNGTRHELQKERTDRYKFYLSVLGQGREVIMFLNMTRSSPQDCRLDSLEMPHFQGPDEE